MSTPPTLGEELQRIADRAPVADVPSTTWARARRARARDRALAVTCGVAAVALVAGLVAWLPHDRQTPPVAAGVGVPETIYALPDDVPSDADLRTGIAAAAYAVDGPRARAVVVTADDGSYHGLDLPDFAGRASMADSATVSLSPDGRSLAYFTTVGEQTGVGVVDLVSGELTDIPAREAAALGGRPALVMRLAWSPNSRWLLWTGQVVKAWTENSRSYGREVAGRIAPGAIVSTPVPPGQWGAAGIADDGDVVVVQKRLLRWDGTSVTQTDVDGPGQSVANSTWVGPTSVSDLRSSVEGAVLTRYDGPARSARAPELRTLETEPLGWIDDHTAVVRTHPTDGMWDRSDLGLLVLPASGHVASYQSVGTAMSGTQSLSLATDLMSAEQATVPRPEPAWVDEDSTWATTWWLLGGGAVLLTGALAGLVALRRRR